jgi:Spherulation-specific family 4
LHRVAAHPNLNFTVIINPDSGPGNPSAPNNDFYGQIVKLNSYSNVKTIGYVHTSYATRDINAVLADVSTYAGWAANSSSIAVNGIFFDEGPDQYTVATAEYVSTINQAVKNSTAFSPINKVCNHLLRNNVAPILLWLSLVMAIFCANMVTRSSTIQDLFQTHA